MTTVAAPAIPATAPAGLAPALRGSARDARVLACSPTVVQVALDDPADLLVLVAPGGIALPNALVLAAGDRADVPLAGIEPGQQARVGQGEVRIPRRGRDDVGVRVARWREHRVRMPILERAVLAQQLAVAPPAPSIDPTLAERFTDLLAAAPHDVGDPTPLLGLGPGSTPEGDDLVAGLLASLLVLGTALGARDALVWARALAATVDRAAPAATSALSASLLRHAGRGEVVPQAAAVLRALAGRGDLADAEARLASLGHTSGRSLVTGIRAGAMLVAAATTSTSTGSGTTERNA